MAGSIKIFGIIIDSRLVEHFHQLLAERFYAMVLVLVGDVMSNRLPSRGADREGGVTLLPRKRACSLLLMYPCGGGFFQFAHDIGKAMRGLQADEQMNVVGHATDAFGKTAQSANRAAKLIVETRPPCRSDDGLTVLGGENEVVVQAEIG